jgi:DNA-binding NtrC family response regulator
VLILDDDGAQGARLKDCFARFHHGCTYEVIAATSTSETLAALRKGRPDLIILEPEMVKFDALSMVTKLRKHESGIPLIAVSKGTKRATTEAIFGLGLFAYMPKPVDLVSFEHIVAMACQSAAYPSTSSRSTRTMAKSRE